MSNQPASSDVIEITLLSGLSEIDQSDWDACAIPDGGPAEDPFTTYRFLKALEDSGSVGVGTGWAPRHLVARRSGQVIGVAPFYAKGHSQGEYVFDHSWAHAYEQAGGSYYPKLISAVPFTPVSERRLLARAGHDVAARAASLEGMVKVASQNEVSSANIAFCKSDEFQIGGHVGFLQRTGQQFHWQNDGYEDFDAFLAALSSRKRKAIRRERRQAQSFGGAIHHFTEDQIEPEHWDAIWTFYQDTGARRSMKRSRCLRPMVHFGRMLGRNKNEPIDRQRIIRPVGVRMESRCGSRYD